MRTLTIAAAAILFAGPAAAQHFMPGNPAVPGAAKPDRCSPTAGIVDYRGGDKVAPRKLGEMPPASQFYAVYNVVDGCPRPIAVRDGVRGNPNAAAPSLRTPPRASRAN